MDDYALDLIPACVEKVQETTGEQDFTIVGYCMGGLLSLLYGGTHPDAPMKNLVCIASPVDMEGMGLFRQWCDPRWFDVDRIVDTLGNVPPEIIYRSFEMLRPTQRVFAYIRLWDNMWNDQYVESYRIFDKWAVEQVPFPGEAFRQMTKELLWENKLMQGRAPAARPARRHEADHVPGAERDGGARPHRAVRGDGAAHIAGRQRGEGGHRAQGRSRQPRRRQERRAPALAQALAVA